MKPDTWETKYWYASQVILFIQDKDLSAWLGANDAVAPMQLLENAEQAIMMAVKTRIEHAKEDFNRLHKNLKERSEFIAANESKLAWERWREFDDLMEGFELSICPCCGASGILGGVLRQEEVSDDIEDLDPWYERVEKTYGSEEFLCKVCKLHLNGRQELKATNLPSEFVIVDDRERVFEPDYGND